MAEFGLPRGFPPDRLMALSDGVFAVALTLVMVAVFQGFEPVQRVLSGSSSLPPLGQALWAAIPHMGTWLLSVGIIGTFWIAHHNIFHLVARADRMLLWYNTAFLVAITVIPLSAFLLASYGERLALGSALYGGNLLVCSIALATIWWYVTREGRRLVKAAVDDHLIRRVRAAIWRGIYVYSAGVLVTLGVEYLVSRQSYWIYFGWPVVVLCSFFYLQWHYMRPGDIDRQIENEATAA